MTDQRPRDLKFYAEAIRNGSTNPDHWITDARAVTEAETAARHAAEDTTNHHAETDAVLETAAYGLAILFVALLIVLLITPGCVPKSDKPTRPRPPVCRQIMTDWTDYDEAGNVVNHRKVPIKICHGS